MRIAFVGKGGSGKTTATALFSKYSSNFVPTFVFDADLNQHIAATLGMKTTSAQTLSECKATLRRELRGENNRYSAEEMIKTTPPGTGSKLFCTYKDLQSGLDACSTRIRNLSLINVGEQNDHDVGVRCYHAKTGVLELLLNHIIDNRTFVISTDMTAGIDAFSSGLFAQFDLTVMLVEPTLKSVAVFQQYADLAYKHQVKLVALGNKVASDKDELFLQTELGDKLVASLRLSEVVMEAEKGNGCHTDALNDNQMSAVFAELFNLLVSTKKDWCSYQESVYDLHRRNAASWGNASVGKDLTSQIDPAFSYAVLAASS